MTRSPEPAAAGSPPPRPWRELWAARDIVGIVALGGMIGAVARWGLGLACDHAVLVTLVINVAGAFALGLLTAVALARFPRSRYLRPFAGTGILGGFTTFSATTNQARVALGAGDAATLLLVTLGTLLLTAAAAWWGLTIGTKAAPASGRAAR